MLWFDVGLYENHTLFANENPPTPHALPAAVSAGSSVDCVVSSIVLNGIELIAVAPENVSFAGAAATAALANRLAAKTAVLAPTNSKRLIRIATSRQRSLATGC